MFVCVPRLFDVVAGGASEDRGGIDKLGGGVLVEAGAVVAEDGAGGAGERDAWSVMVSNVDRLSFSSVTRATRPWPSRRRTVWVREAGGMWSRVLIFDMGSAPERDHMRRVRSSK